MNPFWYRAAFRTAGLLVPCRLEETIVVAGAPRSGTTLIMEVLRALPGYKALNEPLLYQWTQARYGFAPRSYIEPGGLQPRQHAFLARSLTGRLGTGVRWSFPSAARAERLRFHWERRKLVVKFCRINRMLLCVAEAFPTRGILLVIRHPCSVINSMRRFGSWDRSFAEIRDMPGSPVDVSRLPADLRERFAPIAARITTRIEQLALMWCLDHYIPLHHASHQPWTLAPYERLVLGGVPELERLTRALRVPLTEEMKSLLRRPSSSSIEMEQDARAQLAKWKTSLSTPEIEVILRVVREAGLGEVFTDDPVPDYDRLNHLQWPSSAWKPASAGLQPTMVERL